VTVRVLVVDDSSFFRRRLTEMLNADSHIEVVGSAENGAQAIEMAAELQPDVITMDIEMPVMDGILATKKIMLNTPTPILIFSSLSVAGAQATLDALDAGAVDFLPKKFDGISSDQNTSQRLLCARVRVLGARGLFKKNTATSVEPLLERKSGKLNDLIKRGRSLDLAGIRLIAIGTSTGGPVALQKILTEIPAEFSLPILIIQHMPESFTPSFSERLDSLCKINVKHATDGDKIVPGTAYIAPGGSQMLVKKSAVGVHINIEKSVGQQTYKPSVDITFSSLAKAYSSDVLAIVLTGMGADGCEGARLLKKNNAKIWAQDEASCVIYGMPMSVVKAGLADAIVSLDEIAMLLRKRG